MASEGGNTGDDRGSTDHPATARLATADPPIARKLRHIEITNYKAIDHLVLDIPAPTMPGDPDIFVVGSKNGVGKTSLLECCALAYSFSRKFDENQAVLLTNDVIKAEIRSGTSFCTIDIQYHPGRIAFQLITMAEDEDPPGEPYLHRELPSERIEAILGRSINPLLNRGLLMFHSNRKVAEGPMRLQQLLNGGETKGSSAIKQAIVGMLMAKSGLVEGFSQSEAELRLEQLNVLLLTFAGGRVDKFRTTARDQLDLRVSTSKGTNFSFDSLSSGQKEVISTLFLIWDAGRHDPALVLIDEPELHLNAEWQREFIHQLYALAPQNQYILATHSEDIFASVPEDRRVLLGPQG